MPRNPTDDFFAGAKSESYFNSRRELKKHEVTGEAVEMIREFIFENLTAPTYREMMKQKGYQMEVLEVLKQCKLEGNVLFLPDIQMDRKLYLDVAKKIELIGGKWNRKEKGFLFKENPQELFESIKNGDNRNLKKEFQFFATPKELCERLCKYIPEGTKTILEPSAGQGAIIQAINEYDPNIKVSYCELMDLNRKQLKGDAEFLQDDFLTLDENFKFDVIVANPPFSKNQDIEHFYKMLKHATKRVITIMSKHWQHSSFRKETEFKDFIYSHKAQVIEIDAGAFKESGTMISSCIVIFDI